MKCVTQGPNLSGSFNSFTFSLIFTNFPLHVFNENFQISNVNSYKILSSLKFEGSKIKLMGRISSNIKNFFKNIYELFQLTWHIISHKCLMYSWPVHTHTHTHIPFFEMPCIVFLVFGLAYKGKDIVFRFTLEYSSLRAFGPQVVGLFLYEYFRKMIFWLMLKFEISYRVIIIS